MIIAFSLTLLIFTLVFGIGVQYYPYNTWFVVVCTCSIFFTCIGYILYEHIRYRNMISRLSNLLSGEYRGIVNEDEFSELERDMVLQIKSEKIREAKNIEMYRNIASLVSDISHQCKTPLSSLIMYSEMLPECDSTRAIISQTVKLNFLLEVLTKLSKCEGGLIADNLHPAENKISEVICCAVSDIYTKAESKKIEIISEISSNISAVFDMHWTAEAIFNILDNAVKYSYDGSIVKISAYAYDMFVRIDIEDTGCGISEEELCNIWKRFYRGKNSSEHQNSVGIGLYLCQMILTGERGHASVKSQIGRGSVFSVFLPM